VRAGWGRRSRRSREGGEQCCVRASRVSDLPPALHHHRRELLEGECSDADAFPPGSVFVSECFSTAGQLTPLR
jgi:hypothetical protein